VSVFRGDIDIDVANRDEALKSIRHVRASNIDKNGKFLMHNVGIYVQDIPANPVTGAATFEYKVAEEIGYHKIDILNNSIYEDVIDEDHLDDLCEESMVQWDLLEHEEFVEQLPHLSGHFYVVDSIRPRSIEDLAIVLALIRPAKKHLVGKTIYEIEDEIWNKPLDGSYYFKKGHAISYSMSLVVKINLLSEGAF
jgi:hypothetical protein